MNREYEYRSKWTTIILGALFFGACAIVLGAKANGNDHGLVINGIIDLSANGATIFYWVLAALSAGFVLATGILAVIRLTVQQRIALTETSIAIPRSSWSSEEIVVPFGEIVALTPSEVYGQRFLNIVYTGGKFALTASLLPKKEDFDEVCAAIRQGVESAAYAH